MQESWSASDDLLTRLYADKEAAPLSGFVQTLGNESIAHATEESEVATAAAAKAKTMEDDWSAKEAAFAAKAKAMNDEQESLKVKYLTYYRITHGHPTPIFCSYDTRIWSGR